MVEVGLRGVDTPALRLIDLQLEHRRVERVEHVALLDRDALLARCRQDAAARLRRDGDLLGLDRAAAAECVLRPRRCPP